MNLEHLELIADSMVTSGQVNGATLSGFNDLCKTISRSAPFSVAAHQVRAHSQSSSFFCWILVISRCISNLLRLHTSSVQESQWRYRILCGPVW